ncbi:SHOCT domain-containing protein [Clostridium botulinum]|uniref:SHOCT domain-containing protein n=1 Tax=Clostridium botulinum TaxID=1491 RepID=UPI001967A4DA|nr:SHOCT domain-containing protein [Clostridium botulinum]MBN1079305.1 SHOCT domain-containing protein [Clostridium botulinum]
MLKSRVVDGDYVGSYLLFTPKTGIVITTGILKKVKINEDTIKNYEVYDSIKSGLKDVSTKYKVVIEFVDGKKSVIQFDEHLYSKFKLLPLKSSAVEVNTEQKNEKESKDKIIEQIKSLAELKDSGIITEKEFENKKVELLSKI